MSNSGNSQCIIFFPLMDLKQTYQLKFGEIGPISMLIARYPILNDIGPAIMRTSIDGSFIENPVVAISIHDSQKFMGELECLGFLSVSEPQSIAEEEIFGQKTILTVLEEDSICLNGYTRVTPIKQLQYLQFHDFPKAYFRWDQESLARFEDFLSEMLKRNLYTALIECLSDTEDKETRRERSRIIISIALFNQAYIHYHLAQPFSKNIIIHVCSAFEALLNLPSESIRKSFQNTVMTLTGCRTSLFKKWCADFYDYRSALVHGDEAWKSQEKESFCLPDGKRIDHAVIAHHLFIHCLEAKLFLAGLLKNYKPENFSFDDISKVG